jgi:hypothetical protein
MGDEKRMQVGRWVMMQDKYARQLDRLVVLGLRHAKGVRQVYRKSSAISEIKGTFGTECPAPGFEGRWQI